MLDRLEGADGPPELFAPAHVLDGPFQGALGGADGFRGEYGRGRVTHGRQSRGHLAALAGAQQLGCHVPQFDPGAGTCLVKGRPAGTDDSLRVAVHEEEQGA